MKELLPHVIAGNMSECTARGTYSNTCVLIFYMLHNVYIYIKHTHIMAFEIVLINMKKHVYIHRHKQRAKLFRHHKFPK